MFSGMMDGMGNFTKASMGSFKGNFTGNLTETLIGSLELGSKVQQEGKIGTLMGNGEYGKGR